MGINVLVANLGGYNKDKDPKYRHSESIELLVERYGIEKVYLIHTSDESQKKAVEIVENNLKKIKESIICISKELGKLKKDVIDDYKSTINFYKKYYEIFNEIRDAEKGNNIYLYFQQGTKQMVLFANLLSLYLLENAKHMWIETKRDPETEKVKPVDVVYNWISPISVKIFGNNGIKAFNKNHYISAKEDFSKMIIKSREFEKYVCVLKETCEFFHYWDIINYGKAYNKCNKIKNELADLENTSIKEKLMPYFNFFEKLYSHYKERDFDFLRYLAYDLLYNGKRRLNNGEYISATFIGYRLAELITEIGLYYYSLYNISNGTIKINENVEKLLNEDLKKLVKNGKFIGGLKRKADLFIEIHQKYKEPGLTLQIEKKENVEINEEELLQFCKELKNDKSELSSSINIRNQSLAGHGISEIKKENVEKMLDLLEEWLNKISSTSEEEKRLFEFPKLEESDLMELVNEE